MAVENLRGLFGVHSGHWARKLIGFLPVRVLSGDKYESILGGRFFFLLGAELGWLI